MITAPTVSVSIVAYEQERFLPAAVESVLAQQTAFPVEVVIGVDGGGEDRTAAIARAYARRYPDRVRAICHERKGAGVPGRVNNMSNLRACRGRYIATLDGDDLFTSPTKLQRQVDVLESNPDVSLCFHDAEVFWDDDSRAPRSFLSTRSVLVTDRYAPAEFELLDIARIGYSSMPSSSVMMRSDCLRPLPSWFGDILAADYAMQLLACARGRARYEPFVGSRYRQHPASVMQTSWGNLDHLRRKRSELGIYAQHFGLPENTFARHRAWTSYSIARERARGGNFSAATSALGRALVDSPLVFAKRTKDVAFQTAKSWSGRVGSYFRAAPRPSRRPIAPATVTRSPATMGSMAHEHALRVAALQEVSFEPVVKAV